MQPWIWPCSLLVLKSRSTSPGLQVFRSSFCRALTNHLNLMIRPDMATNVHTTWVCSVRLSIRSYVLHMLLFTITYRKYSVSGAMRTRSIISNRRSSCVHSSCLPGCMGGWGGRRRSVSQLLQCDIYRHDMAHLTHPTCNLGPHPGTCDQYCLTQSQTSLCVLVSSPHRFLHELFPVWNWHQPVADFVLICLLCCIWLQLSSFLLKT